MRFSVLLATKQTALMVSIFVSKKYFIFLIISKSTFIPFVSPKPGESTMTNGGFSPQALR
jgi:hypothetical protein